ncbi:MAG: HDOD domain-containing protein, partial [Nitrospirae bacterium]|nr:HDOD domain-containing protein [Nitrospirota bacterium]
MSEPTFASPLLQGLEERFQNRGDLPILRDTVVHVMKITEDQVSGAPELSRVVLRDQGLTAKILKVANSVYYNPGDKEINTISRAVVLIGFDMIRTISLGLAFVEMFQKRHPDIDLKGMVARSFIAATQALEIARTLRHPEPEEVFISTLLYHLGSLSVAYYLPEVYLQARELESTAGLSREEAETKVLGFPFHHVGAAFAKEWNLPDGVVETLSNPRFDPAPARTPSDRLRSIAHLSNRITENLFTAGGDDRDLEGLLKALQTTLEIRPEEGVRLVEISYRKAREVSGLFGLEMEAVRPQPEA